MAEEWITVTEAAARESAAGRKITKGNVSRYLKRFSELPVRKDTNDRVVQVEYAALRAHRETSVQVDDKQTAMAEAAPRGASTAPAPPSASDRKRAAEAERAELELAARKGELISRATVTRAIADIGVALSQAIDRAALPLAQRLEGLDTRAAELEIKRTFRDMQTSVAQQLDDVARGGAPASAENPQTE